MKASELHARMERGDVELLDVRTELEFNQGHLPGARNIPLDRLQADGSFTPENAARPLCIICQSGKRAEKALAHLQSACGIESCTLEGGMNAWQESGRPVQKNRGTHGITLIRQVQMIIGAANLLGLVLAWQISFWWLLLPAMTSLGLLMAGLTGFCGLAVLLSKMPWNRIEH